MTITRIVAIGDTHVGSIYGLASPTSVPVDKQNAFLDWIFQVWEDFCKKYKNPDYLLLIGDIADGSQVMTLGVDALTTNTDEQVDIAEKLLNMLIGKSTKVYGINGSGYHGGERQGTNIDRRIIEKVNGDYKGGIFEFDIDNEKIQVAHGGAGNSLVNPSTYIQREIRLSKEDAQKGKRKGPTILLRGHQHRFYTIQDDAGVYGVLNGCWQYTTPFMVKKSANVSPSIGAVIIDIENGKVKIYREEYPIPEMVRQSMNGFEQLYDKRNRTMSEKNKEIWKKSLKERKY